MSSHIEYSVHCPPQEKKNRVFLEPKLEVGILVLLIGAWLTSHPYRGIWQDGVLYTGQALKHLYPAIYSIDPFFAKGSQDEYTIFPPLYAWAIRVWGLGKAAFGVTALGQILWFVAAAVLARTLSRGPLHWLGLALLISVSPYYGAVNIFSYGEPTVTARIFAESTDLLALAMALRHRWLRAWGLTIISGAFHPLVVMPVLSLIVLLTLPRPRHELGLVAAALMTALLVIAASSPDAAAGILRDYDPEWLGYVRTRNAFVFLGTWSADAWAAVALATSILLSVYCIGDETSRRVSRAVLLTTASALLISAVGADFSHHVLITQLQLWRFLWLYQVLGLLMLAPSLGALWKGAVLDKLQAGALVCLLLLEGESRLWFAAISTTGWLWLRHYQPRWRPLGIHRFLLVTAVAAVLGLKVLSFGDWRPVFNGKTLDPDGMKTLVDPIIVLLGGWSIISFQDRFPAITANLTALVAIVYLGLGAFWWSIMVWEKTPPVGAQYETAEELEVAASLQSIIPAGATVYWERGARNAWFLLKRAHYASFMQGAGALYSRDTTMVLLRRQDILDAENFSDGDFSWNKPDAPDYPQHTSAQLRVLCSDHDLDFLILARTSDVAPDMAFNREDVSLEGYVYRCDRFRLSPSTNGSEKRT